METDISDTRDYYIDTVGKNQKRIEEYIRNQLEEDKLYDQLSLKEYLDPFDPKEIKLIKQKPLARDGWNKGTTGEPLGDSLESSWQQALRGLSQTTG